MIYNLVLRDDDYFRQQIFDTIPQTQDFLHRYSEIVRASKGRLSILTNGNIEIDGHVLKNTNLINVLRFIIKGLPPGRKTEGAHQRDPPNGFLLVAKVLREGDVNLKLFTKSIKTFLNKNYEPFSEEINATTPTRTRASDLTPLSSPRSSRKLPTPQTGEGLLQRAMNYAEEGEHGAAFDFLNEAKKSKAPRGLVKKTEAYLDSLRN